MIKLNYSLQFYRAPFFLPLVALLILLSAFASTYASPLSNFASDDQRFLALRDAASKEDVGRAAELAGQLSTYSLPAYVDYYVVKSHLRTASTTEITDFLARHANAAIADRLRNDWLLMLGHQRNWALFDAQYPLFVLNDDTQVKCYALLSKLQQGQNVADGARNLLTSSKVYGEGCFALFSDLVSSGQFSPTDMWNQLRWSAEANTTDITVQLAKLVDLDYAAKVLSKPNNKLEAEFTRPLPKSDEVRQTTLIALGRIARSDPDRAVNLLKKIDHGLNDSERSIAWSQIALASAQKLQPEAAEYWTRIGDASLSLDAYQWRVRTALRNLDWRRVKAAIESMPATLLNDSAWVYWLGRAYVADNKSDVAQPLFQGIADRPTFYGQLALEERGLQIVVPPTTPVQTLDLIALTKNSGLQDALHFYAMGLRLEGNREWNWQLRSMSEPQLLAAAEFARENDLLDRTVSTHQNHLRLHAAISHSAPGHHGATCQPAESGYGLGVRPDTPGIALYSECAFQCWCERLDAGHAGYRTLRRQKNEMGQCRYQSPQRYRHQYHARHKLPQHHPEQSEWIASSCNRRIQCRTRPGQGLACQSG
jgi:soluble lytic murein transglycosylase